MAPKRFQTYFGIPFPPWREKKIRTGTNTYTIWFALKGRVPSKKNNQQAVTRRNEAADYLNDLFAKSDTINKAQAFTAIKKVSAKMRGNDQYKAFLEEQSPFLEEQQRYWQKKLADKGLIFPISEAALSIRFYFAQKYRQDSVNKQQSIQDILKDCRIILDDDYTVTDPTTSAGRCYAGEIKENLTYIRITFSL